MPANYIFIVSPELLNRFEEVRQHHIVKYGPTGCNSDLITFIQIVLCSYFDFGGLDDIVEDSLIDFCSIHDFHFSAPDVDSDFQPDPEVFEPDFI